jgi:hypothetical protein
MNESAGTAGVLFPGSTGAGALYCEKCLRVDQSFNDIRKTATNDRNFEQGDRRLLLSLIADSASVKAETLCPSCRDILDLLGERASEAEYVNLVLQTDESFKYLSKTWTKIYINISTNDKGNLEGKEIHLFRRSNYPMRLRNYFPSSTKATNLPIALIKPWLQTCDHEHEFCRVDPFKKPDISLFLIDVVEECIIFVPISKLRYVALSYVWGNVEPTRVTSENLETLRKPHSLSSRSQVATVPRTIRDAMHLTADLDLRYLWVDSLCLIQNDPNLGLYLSQMHLIYKNAYLTVVVADKDNANGGITGYETCSTGRILPGQTINYPNYVLSIKDHDYFDRDLPWRKRGWTLQEGVFSRRALVIANRVFLICAKSYQEEGEDFGSKNNFHRVTNDMGTFLSSVCSSSTGPLEAGSPSHRSLLKLSAYTDIVFEFAVRDFSHDSDVIKAFSGVLTFFAMPRDSEDALSLMFGHPVIYFATSLLWTSDGCGLRRRTIPLLQDGLPGVPSWSWMAWKHGSRPHLKYFFTPPVGWIGIQDLPPVIRAQCGTCLEIHEVTNEKCKNEAASEYIDWECLNPYLYITAPRVQFGVLTYQEQYGTDEGYNKNEGQEEDTNVLIYSKATQNEKLNIVGEMNSDFRPIKSTTDESGAFDFIGIVCYMDFRDVMLVEALCIKPSDDRPNVFERVGVARIRKDAWDQIAKFDENIILG